MKFLEATGVVAFVLVLGAADLITGYDLSFFPFYFIPIAVVASSRGAKSAYTVAFLCSVTWFTSDCLTGHPYPKPWLGAWNALMRLIAFVLVAYLIVRIRALLLAAQKEVGILQEFLPICTKCGKIRDTKGYWQQMEQYISRHADIKFRLCDHCAAGMLHELYDVTAVQSSALRRQPAVRPGEGGADIATGDRLPDAS